MEEIKLDNGIKKIAIKNEDDEVITVLEINVADANTVNKFEKTIHDLENISNRSQAEAEEWTASHKNKDDEKEMDLAVEINDIRVKYINEIINSLDELFGAGTVHNIFGDIVPDEVALVDFVEKIIPVINKLFGKRLELNRKRFNSNRRGANR